MLSRLFAPRRVIPCSKFSAMKVVPIPANADNYQYLLIDEATKTAAIIDPVDIPTVVATSKAEGVKLTSALVTHHHWDHAAGTKQLSQTVSDVTIYGGDQDRIEAISKVLEHGEQFKIGNLNVKALRTPCHTSSHICYYVTDEANNDKAVFTGDTLFIAGCGRFFEGTAEEMNEALNVRLASLPDETNVYCGHEYTVTNLKFAKSVEPDNKAVTEKLAWAENERAKSRFTIPSTIGAEKTFNPFMRCDETYVMKSLGVNDPIKAMAKLREMKNNFKG